MKIIKHIISFKYPISVFHSMNIMDKHISKHTEKQVSSIMFSIIIPCYNEEDGIAQLSEKLEPILKELEKKGRVELLFIDDGSTDSTVEKINKHFKNYSDKNANNQIKYRIIRHERNMNLGVALRTGFSNATGEFIITADSDCTYEPKTILEMFAILDSNTDVVTVSPYHPKGKVTNVPGYRLLLSKSISMIYRIILGRRAKGIYTFTALNRIYRRRVVESVKFKSNNFLATAELLIGAIKKEYRVKELPATLNVRRYGVSKIRLLSVIWSHFKYVLRLIFCRN